MKYGFIGAGDVSFAIASKLVSLGHDVALSSRRGAASIADRVRTLGANAEAVSVETAAANDIVFLAVPWAATEAALSTLPAWENRILIDTTNPFVKTASGYAVAVLGERSASEVVAEYAPGARVVKAFNSILMSNFKKGPTQDGVRRVLFVSGDDVAAKKEVTHLIEAFGFAAIDLGNLAGGGRLQQGDGPLAGQDLLLFAPWQRNG
jgi:predicted dinucleotide-binding enzyme